jgi:hypothetical protein
MKTFQDDSICPQLVEDLLSELRRHEIAGPLYAQLLSTDKRRFMLAAYLEDVPFTPRSKQGKAANVSRRKLLRMAERVVEPLRVQLQKKLKKHVVVKVNILVSLPGAASQEVHLDFSEEVLTGLDVSEMPFSILLPLHDYCLFNLQLHGKYDTITPVTIPYGMYVQFRGDLWHFGGINPLSIVQYRIHAYFATTIDIIPKDAVFK